MTWPSDWGNVCPANLSPMLSEVLKVKAIGSEIKLIWNASHRHAVVKDNNVTYQQLEDYLKADCSLLSFQSVRTRTKAVKAIEKMGGKGFICIDSYREVILSQAHYHVNKSFPLPAQKMEIASTPEPIIHELKTSPQHFNAIMFGFKAFEIRKNDRDFQVGHYLRLKEWYKDQGYSGDQIVKRIKYIVYGGQFGLHKDYVVMQLEDDPIGPLGKLKS